MACELYRAYDGAGTLLYVGMSLSAMVRLNQHREGSVWFPHLATLKVERCETRDEARQKERAAIRDERPKWNKHHRNGLVPKRVRTLDDDGVYTRDDVKRLHLGLPVVRDLLSGALVARWVETGVRSGNGVEVEWEIRGRDIKTWVARHYDGA